MPHKSKHYPGDPYQLVKQHSQKEAWTYEGPEGLSVYVADGKGRSGTCVGTITWRYLKGALKRKKK